MFYRAFRAVVTWVLRLFFDLETPVDEAGGLALDEPVIYVGNHPNGLVDPGLVFVLARRHVTFLAKAPLFRLPVLGWMLKAMGALPVFRKQDGADTGKNEGTLSASVEALCAGRAITLFPEGKSHSEPQLSELKTGCARIALTAAKRGADVHIVPVGFTYSQKNRFRSRVHVEVGPALKVKEAFGEQGPEPEPVRELTDRIADALREVTFNLEHWEDLPLVETAEALYALEQGDEAGDVGRQRAFAKGLKLLRHEQPERFEALKRQLAAFRLRLDLIEVTPGELAFRYHFWPVVRFALRNAMWLVGLPFFLAGMVLFAIPYWIPPLLVLASRTSDDVEATVKVLTLMLLAPLWWAGLTLLAWWQLGLVAGVTALVAIPPLALFTRYYLERRAAAWRDTRTFSVLVSRRRLKRRLLAEGKELAAAITEVAEELKPRVVAAAG